MKKYLAAGIVVASVLGLTTVAKSSIIDNNVLPTLTVSGGTSSAIYSNASGVVTTGAISLDNWSVIITTGETKPALGTASSPQMDVSIQASSIGAGTLYISFSDTGFTGAGSLVLTNLGHIVSGASETVGTSVYGNTANVLGTLTSTGSQVNFGSFLAGVPVQSMPIQASASGSLPGSSPYALTEYIVLNTSASSSTSIDASFITVPEPSTVLLTAMGALTLLWQVRRRGRILLNVNRLHMAALYLFVCARSNRLGYSP